MARLEMVSADLATIGGRPLSTDVFFELGVMYSSGRDVEIDLVSAHINGSILLPWAAMRRQKATVQKLRMRCQRQIKQKHYALRAAGSHLTSKLIASLLSATFVITRKIKARQEPCFVLSMALLAFR